MFVDVGPTADIIDPDTGEVRQAQILGASSYTYAEGQWSQNLPNFIVGHVNAFNYFGGVSALIVPDNLKAGVRKADRYEPLSNRTYTEMAQYYGFAILPACPYRPKDKSKVEVAVQVVERWILVVLRH